MVRLPEVVLSEICKQQLGRILGLGLEEAQAGFGGAPSELLMERCPDSASLRVSTLLISLTHEQQFWNSKGKPAFG